MSNPQNFTTSTNEVLPKFGDIVVKDAAGGARKNLKFENRQSVGENNGLADIIGAVSANAFKEVNNNVIDNNNNNGGVCAGGSVSSSKKVKGGKSTKLPVKKVTSSDEDSDSDEKSKKGKKKKSGILSKPDEVA